MAHGTNSPSIGCVSNTVLFCYCILPYYVIITHLLWYLINPRHMCHRIRVFGLCLCVCVCLSVTKLTATGLYVQSEAVIATVSCRLLKDLYCMDLFCLGDLSLAIQLFLIKYTPMALDTITNGIVYEPLARSDD